MTDSLPMINSDTASQLQLRQTLGFGRITEVAWSLDGQVLAVGGARGIWLYPATDLNNEGRLLEGHTGLVTGIAFSPTDNRLASTSVDSTIRVWDIDTGAELHTLQVPDYTFEAVTFS